MKKNALGLVLKSPVLWGLLVVACSSARSDNTGGTVLPPSVNEPSTPPSPQPDFGQVVSQQEPPPPISGGTLAVDKTQGIAVASDPDRDRVYVVDIAARSVRHTIQLDKHTEPGRVALSGAGLAFVALRSSGQLATIDLDRGSVSLAQACVAPRGVTYDAKKQVVLVACASGDLLTFLGNGQGPTTRIAMGRDLRDVILVNGNVMTTRFRSAHLVPLTPANEVGSDRELGGSNLAWRAVAAPPDPGNPSSTEETPAVVTQDPSAEPVKTEPGGYGSGDISLGSTCGTSVGIVSTRLWLAGDTGGSVRIPTAVLPVDLATNGREFVVVAAGNSHTKQLPQLFIVQGDQLRQGTQECVNTVQGSVPGQAIAAAFDQKDELLVQTREPAALHIMSDDRRRPMKTIILSSETREDTGHAIFHSNAGGNIACASCHAEGADDGRTWEFVGMGPRRTPSLLGTTRHTEPFHWNGDMKDLSTLVDHVFVERMSGPKIDKNQVDVLGNFLFTLPPPAKLRAEADVPARGKQLFEQRCSSCHAGDMLTNNKSVDIGTGDNGTSAAFQVPSLIGIGWRAPYLHNGCAKTLFDRFNPGCGGSAHGDTKDLSKDQIADIVSFLETL